MRKTRLLLLALAFLFCSGCALVDKWNAMSDKQRVLFVVSAYNGQFALLRAQWGQYANLSPEDQKLLRWKKQILVEAHALVSQYLEVFRSGGLRDISLEEQVLRFLQLIIDASVAPPDFEQEGVSP